MEEKNHNRVHPMFKFTNQSGTILKEVFEREFLYKMLKNSSIDSFKTGAKITIDNEDYVINRIDVIIAEFMWGDVCDPTSNEGDLNQFNTVINIILK